jgi:glyoxylase-like metal-dependent hydrolase (beta-lactamase superfamily II)
MDPKGPAVIREIYPSLFLLRPEKPTAKTQFTYFLKRADGNVLFATKADLSPFVEDLDRLGGVAHMLLGDRHHATPATMALANHFGTVLSCSHIEATALRGRGVTVEKIIPYRRNELADDLEVIPTPGHTRGAFSYLWTNQGRKFLFIGDTIVPISGTWEYWVTKPNRAEMIRTMHMLGEMEFDVILSNSFAAAPVAWVESDPSYRKRVFAWLASSLTV